MLLNTIKIALAASPVHFTGGGREETGAGFSAIAFICERNNIISLFPLDQGPKTIRKTLVHDDQVFIKARDFYQRNMEMRHHKILVYDENRQPIYSMGWKKNKLVNVFRNKDTSQTHLSNFWDYALPEEGLDYTYVDRYELIIYEELEEYSYHTARMALAHNPALKLALTVPLIRIRPSS